MAVHLAVGVQAVAGNVILSEADHGRVSAAVAIAEEKSDGEFVTMVIRASDDYGDWALMLATVAAFAKLTGLALFHDQFLNFLSWIGGTWHADFSAREQLSAALGIAVLTFTLVWFMLQWMPLRLALTPRAIKIARVRRRAIDAFRIGIASRTRARTGVLVYLSLAEHRAEILGDEAINSRIAAADWGDAMDQLIADVRDGRPADGIVAAVGMMGALVARHFPRSSDDTNELPDRLIEL